MPEPKYATPEEIRQWVEKGDLRQLLECNPSVKDVEELLEEYPDKVNEEDKYGCLPLHYAVGFQASVEVINLLLEKNKSAAEKKNNNGELPLHFAVKEKCGLDVVKALLDAYPGGAKAIDENGQLPLDEALRKGCGVDVVKAVIEAYPEGAKETDRIGRLPLHFALSERYGVGIMKELLNAYPEGAREEVKLMVYPEGATEEVKKARLPIHLALNMKSEVDVLKALLQAYPEGTKEADGGKLPLHIALSIGYGVYGVKALLEAYPEGAKEEDEKGMLPIHLALKMKSEFDVVKTLLDANPEGARAKDKNGNLPLHIALSTNCEVNVVQDLLKRYPDATMQTDNEGRLPLHIALLHDVDYESVLEVFIKGRRALLWERDNYGKVPIHIAAQYYKKDIRIVKELVSFNNGGLDARDNEWKLPLQVAIEHEREVDIVELFLRNYPEGVKTLGKVGNKAFRNAIDEGYPKEIIIALLLADMPLDNYGNFIPNDGSWNLCVATNKDVAVDAVRRILSKDGGDFGRYIHTLMDVRDARGRQALGLASERALSEINVYLLFCGRYKLNLGSPEHRTLTSILLRALDLDDKADYYGNIFAEADMDGSGTLDRQEMDAVAKSIGLSPELFFNVAINKGGKITRDDFVSICKHQSPPRSEVVIQLMRSKEHWQRECDARKKHNLNPKYVVSALPNIPSVEEFYEAVRERKGGLDIIEKKYLEDIDIGKYAIVMDAPDRNLHQIFYQEQPKIDSIRDILRQVFEAVNHLHEKKLMHGDLKMLNIVRMRVDNRLRLINFNASAEIIQSGEDGESFAGAPFSSAILPPEMIAKLDAEEVGWFNEYWQDEYDEGLLDKVAPKAHSQRGVEVGQYVVKSYRTDWGEPVFEGLPYELVDASENIDVWSLGVLAFTLLTGEPLIPSTRDDDCASGAAMHLLYTWGEQPQVLFDCLKKIPNKAACDLVWNLLQRNPQDRPSLEYLLRNHAFFHPGNADLASVMNENFDKITRRLVNEIMKYLQELLKNKPSPTEVRTLLQHLSNIGCEPLYTAISYRASTEVITLLFNEYPDGAKAQNGDGNLPLHIALSNKYGLDVVGVLLKEYPNGAKTKNNDENLPLHMALSNRCERDVLKLMLNEYPDGAKAQNSDGNLPLHMALSNKYSLDVVEALLNEYPDGAKTKNNEDKFPLHLAAENKLETQVLNALIDAYPHGAKAMDNKGCLPLNYAIQKSLGPDATKLLIEAYPEGSSNAMFDGRLPLHYVIQEWRDVDVIKVLIKAYPAGASMAMPDGKLPFFYSIEQEYSDEVILTLLEADMPVDLVDGSPKTCGGSWNYCVSLDDKHAVDLVRQILAPDKGDFGRHIHALVDARDADGRKALDMAKLESREVIHKYLLFCQRYMLQMGPLEHVSLTSILVRAQDLLAKDDYSVIFQKADKDDNGNLDRNELKGLASSLGLTSELFLKGSAESESNVSEEEFIAICKRQLGDGPREVVIKFMQSKDHWERECNARKGLSPKYVVSALTNVPSEEVFAKAVRERKGGLDIIKEKFLEDIAIGEHIIVMHAADRNLQQIFYQEQPKIGAIREILRQVFEAVNHLHEKNLMHGDLKMLNIVRMRVDNQLRLIDFDASAKIVPQGSEEKSFAGAKFSSAILPPEMIAKIKPEHIQDFNKYWGAEKDKGLEEKVAPKTHMQRGVEVGQYVVKSFRTKGGQPVVEDLLPYKFEPASANIDAWSLGVLAFALLTGEPLIPSNRDDDCASGAAMHLLYTWGEQPETLLDRFKKIGNEEARDLVFELLQREPSKRPTIASLLKTHPFFQTDNLSIVRKMDARLAKIQDSLQDQAKKLEEMNANILVIKKLSYDSMKELLFTRDVLLKAIFEATEVTMPTCFIILYEKLPDPSKEAEKEIEKFLARENGSGVEFKSKYASVSLSADGADIDVELPETVQKYKSQVETGLKWAERIRKIGKKFADGAVSSAFEDIKEEIIQEQLVGNKMYFYFVDDLTGEPVQAPGYPIEITTPSDLVPKLLPLMQVGMRAMSVFNGTAGIARMFGCPLPKIPKAWSEGLGQSVELLKKKSSVEDFNVVHDAVEGGNEEKQTVRGKSLRDFMDFLEVNDPGLSKGKNGDFAGLQRIGDPDQGTALWTTLTDPEEIEKALKERTRQRLEEERKEAELALKRDESLSQLKEKVEDTIVTEADLPITSSGARNSQSRETTVEISDGNNTGGSKHSTSEIEEMINIAAEKAASVAAEKAASAAAKAASEAVSASKCCVIM